MHFNSEGQRQKAVARPPLLYGGGQALPCGRAEALGKLDGACSGPLLLLLIQVRQAGFLCVAAWALWAGSGGNLSASCSCLSPHICEAASFHCH